MRMTLYPIYNFFQNLRMIFDKQDMIYTHFSPQNAGSLEKFITSDLMFGRERSYKQVILTPYFFLQLENRHT